MLKILLLDDDRSAPSALAEVLLAEDFDVTATADGDHAATLLEGGTFQLLVVDLGEPQLHGLELIRRARRALAPLPIIAVMAPDSNGAHYRALVGGANACVEKPISLKRLLAAIARLTGPQATSPRTEQAT